MNKQSKVTHIQPNGHWDGQYGLMYKFEITMENGDHGQYMSKSKEQGKFIVGVEANYTHDTTRPEFPKIKPFNDFQPSTSANTFKGSSTSKNSPDVQRMIVRQSSLKAAVDYCNINEKHCSTIELLQVADVFVAWVYEVESKSSKMQEVGGKGIGGEGNGMGLADKSDMPF